MRYVAFLRAINVGGHNITMADLRKFFEQMGLGAVETFIASGNVIFESGRRPAKLEEMISSELRKSLGYAVPAFLRTLPELKAVSEAEPFAASAMASAVAHNVAFTGSVLTPEQCAKIGTFESGVDQFAAAGREIFWICRARQSESRFSSAAMERSLGTAVTWRGMNTVRRLVDRISKPMTTAS